MHVYVISIMVVLIIFPVILQTDNLKYILVTIKFKPLSSAHCLVLYRLLHKKYY